jgi:ABC-2 type transport system ATP-binding protein
MLAIKNLTKRYEAVTAVNDVSFDVNDGEIAVLLGPNGAGKSTTMKCITGLLRYDGSIEVCGHPNKSIEAKKLFGYVPETPAPYELLTVHEHLEFIAHAYNLKDCRQRRQELLDRFELSDKRDKLGRELSKGMQQKLSICCALVIEPRVVLFDEPMVGLDPRAIKELKSVFLELKEQGASILISTHLIDSIAEVWDRTLIMKNGGVASVHARQELESGRDSLEDLYFQVTEG